MNARSTLAMLLAASLLLSGCDRQDAETRRRQNTAPETLAYEDFEAALAQFPVTERLTDRTWSVERHQFRSAGDEGPFQATLTCEVRSKLEIITLQAELLYRGDQWRVEALKVAAGADLSPSGGMLRNPVELTEQDELWKLLNRRLLVDR